MKTAFCFGLDGVITTRDLLPALAAELGYEEEIRILTEAARIGQLPGENAYGLCYHILSDLPVARVHTMLQRLPLFLQVVRFMQSRCQDCYLITDHPVHWIDGLVHRLGVRCCAPSASTQAVPARSIDKAQAVRDLRSGYERLVAIGHSMADVPLFEAADIGVAFGGLYHPVETIIQMSDLVCYSETALCQTLDTL